MSFRRRCPGQRAGDGRTGIVTSNYSPGGSDAAGLAPKPRPKLGAVRHQAPVSAAGTHGHAASASAARNASSKNIPGSSMPQATRRKPSATASGSTLQHRQQHDRVDQMRRRQHPGVPIPRTARGTFRRMWWMPNHATKATIGMLIPIARSGSTGTPSTSAPRPHDRRARRRNMSPPPPTSPSTVDCSRNCSRAGCPSRPAAPGSASPASGPPGLQQAGRPADALRQRLLPGGDRAAGVHRRGQPAFSKLPEGLQTLDALLASSSIRRCTSS